MAFENPFSEEEWKARFPSIFLEVPDRRMDELFTERTAHVALPFLGPDSNGSMTTSFAAASYTDAQLAPFTSTELSQPPGFEYSDVTVGGIELGSDLHPGLVSFGNDSVNDCSSELQLTGRNETAWDDSTLPWMTAGYDEAEKSWEERGWIRPFLTLDDLIPPEAHFDVFDEASQRRVGTKRSAEDALDGAPPQKRKKGTDAKNTRPQEYNEGGWYVDNKVHKVESSRLKHIVPMTGEVTPSPVLIAYRVKSVKDTLGPLKFCDINQIDMQGVGADVFRCPVPGCNAALVRRHTVRRHFTNVHNGDVRAQGLKWTDHPTMHYYGGYKSSGYIKKETPVAQATEIEDGDEDEDRSPEPEQEPRKERENRKEERRQNKRNVRANSQPAGTDATGPTVQQSLPPFITHQTC